MWMNGARLGAVLRISASSAATSLWRGSWSWARYSAGVDALSWPFIFPTAYHGRRAGRAATVRERQSRIEVTGRDRKRSLTVAAPIGIQATPAAQIGVES